MTRLLLTAAFVSLAAQGGLAEEADPGKAAFTQYCATCHGIDAQGGGSYTELITAEVPDLTQLTVRNEGRFPMLEVIHIIDGRSGLRGHGGPMPVYGALFDEEIGEASPYGSPLYTRGKILSIAYYLEGVQDD